MASLQLDPGSFKALDANPGGTLELFNKYVDRIKLIFDLAFRKADGTPYEPTDREKKAMLLFRGGDDMKDLFQHVGGVLVEDTFEQAIDKISAGLKSRTNSVVQRNLLLANFPQGTKTFDRWSKEVTNAAKLIDFTNYDWKQAAVDAILLQTSNPKLRERALQDNVTYDELFALGIAKEQSAKGAALLEKASGQADAHQTTQAQEVRRLQKENQRLKARLPKPPCPRCGSSKCDKGKKCPAWGQKCSACSKMNHFAKACRSNQNRRTTRRLSSAEESDSAETSGRIVVGKLNTKSISVKIKIQSKDSSNEMSKQLELATDTGVSKTILNRNDWNIIKSQCKFVKTSKRFRPFGTTYHLPIRGKAHVMLTAQKGAQIDTYVYIVDDPREQSLLGEEDAKRLGIVKLNPDGATHEIIPTDLTVKRITYPTKSSTSSSHKHTTEAHNEECTDSKMEQIIQQFPDLFSNNTGKFKGDPIQIHVKPDAIPIVQPPRRIPLHYIDRLHDEINKMVAEDIIEGPLETEEPGTYISNLVITEKKWDPKRIRVTLDCQQVNKDIYKTNEPIPTTEELRHKLKGSNRFSVIDITNCYHQFEIEPEARKLYGCRTPWGIFRFKRMVMGTSPASSEIQKRLRESIKDCTNAINIKDDILIYGKDDEHDKHLIKVLKTLCEKGLTLRKEKCSFGKPEVKWFGNIYSEMGMSPDPEKCEIIQNWPQPTTCAEVKSFLQTVQFNAKFLSGKNDKLSYPELTKPLRELTKKNTKFHWGPDQSNAFHQLKARLCSDDVLVPYDTKLPTRLYVDSSPIGTQATIAQEHTLPTGEVIWRPVNHTSRSWTPAEAGYSQIERESNGILTGMLMNKMYTLGTTIEVVTDHQPLVAVYNNPVKPKQLRIDRHRTKLLPFQYSVIYEPGTKTPCDYGSRHPPIYEFNEDLTEKWGIENGTEIYVNRIIEELLPRAVTTQMIQSELNKDKILLQLKEDIITNKYCRNSLTQYKKIFDELTVINDIIVRENKIIIPKSLQADVIGLAHEGHAGCDKTLKLLRETCWFPGMSQMVKEYVETCRPCNAAIPNTRPQPLQPNMLPDRPWQAVHADFKGPIGAKYYLHIVIDQYSKYPEVDIVKSTSFEKLKPCLDRIIASHGIPEKLSTDNGSPYFSTEMREYTKQLGIDHDPVTPEDPQSNGFAESFVKIICKFIHSAIAEGKDPKTELQNYLLIYRSTPHTTTGKSPAEMLYGRTLKTKLPQMFTKKDSHEMIQVRDYHNKKKIQQKENFDKHHRAKEKHITVGDKVLIRQTKTTTKPPFDPLPYNVTQIKGNRITAQRNNQKRIRDKNHVKLLKDRPFYLNPSWNKKPSGIHTNYEDFEIEGTIINKPRKPLPSLSPATVNLPTQVSTQENSKVPGDIYESNEYKDITNPQTSHRRFSRSLFDITQEEHESMQSLFANALDSTTDGITTEHNNSNMNMTENSDARLLRSHNIQLSWNKELNNGPTVVRSEDKIN